jgi:hypothetical protein
MTRGFGSIILLIVVVAGVVALGITNLLGLPIWGLELLWGLPAAALNAILCARYARVEAPKFAVDRTTMEEVQVTFPRKHDLFWIPVRFWTYIILGYTCIGMIQEFHLL